MARGSPAQAVFPFSDPAEELPCGDRQDSASGWERILLAAFTDPKRSGGFLPQAEKAVRAQPGDGHILLLAATAALTSGHGFAGWARPAGVLVGGVLAARRAPFPVVVLAAAGVTALLRLTGLP